jgi:hypothetical protein
VDGTVIAVACLFIGAIGLSMGILEFRDFRRRKGDFSAWILGGTTKVTRTLWLTHAWTEMIVLLLIGCGSVGVGLWLLLKE